MVLRNPVLIGSKELLMIPPFAILIPPFTLMVDAFRVEGMPPPLGGGYTAPFIELMKRLAELMVLVLRAFAKMEPVLIVAVLMADALTPPLRVARPFTDIASCINTFPEPTLIPSVTTEIPPETTINAPFVIVCPPFTVSVDAFRVEGMPPPPPGGYTAPFTELTFILAVLILMVLRAGDLIVSPALKIEAFTEAPNCCTARLPLGRNTEP